MTAGKLSWIFDMEDDGGGRCWGFGGGRMMWRSDGGFDVEGGWWM